MTCLTCGTMKHLSPDPWLGDENLQAKPPECPIDLRQKLLAL